MYLNNLSNQQKSLFLDLCIHAAYSNNEIDNDERKVIDLYCTEMQMPNARYTAEKELNEVLSELVKISTKSELKMITIEIYSLVLSDKIFDEYEQKFMKDLFAKLDITKDDQKEIISFINELSSIYKEINDFIFH